MRVKLSIAATAVAAVAGGFFTLSATQVNASTVVSAVSATASTTFVSSMGEDYNIIYTLNQAGLLTNYTSGVTDWDAYFALNPLHDWHANAQEWFSSTSSEPRTVTYDLGGVYSIDKLALWNDDYAGFGQAVITTSLDNSSYLALATINPTDNPLEIDYLAQVFQFATTSARYFRLSLTGCPQAGARLDVCGIGEVAFSAVPLPAALPLFGTGLALLGFWGRRRLQRSRAPASV